MWILVMRNPWEERNSFVQPTWSYPTILVAYNSFPGGKAKLKTVRNLKKQKEIGQNLNIAYG